MPYRTRIYIAADWDGDNNLVSTLQEWNESEYWDLSFPDAHELTQARDASKACSIKKSLYTRLERSKTFVLIVGKQTASLRKGSCQYCPSYTDGAAEETPPARRASLSMNANMPLNTI